jgi:hypothetical protein
MININNGFEGIGGNDPQEEEKVPLTPSQENTLAKKN